MEEGRQAEHNMAGGPVCLVTASGLVTNSGLATASGLATSRSA